MQDTPGVEATPPSPLAKVIETPRDVSCMYESHKELRKYGSDQYTRLKCHSNAEWVCGRTE